MIVKHLLLLVLAVGFSFARVAAAGEADPEAAAIRATALDYIDGFYTGDGARMERAVHSELAKRIVTTDPKTGKSTLGQMSAMTLVQRTRSGSGKRFSENQRQHDVTILDRFENAAVVKIVAAEWIGYLELAKVDGEWKIINVLWELKPKPEGAAK
jgi:hypothetical protein